MTDPTCPICQRALPDGRRTATYPFCCARCKWVDLGNWLGDRYVIAGPAADGVDALDDEALAALFREPS